MGLDLKGGYLVNSTFSPRNRAPHYRTWLPKDDLWWSWRTVDMVEGIWCCFAKMWKPGGEVITWLSDNEKIYEHGVLILDTKKPCECVPEDSARNVCMGLIKGLSKKCEIITPGGDEDRLIQSSIQEVLQLWQMLKQEYGDQATIITWP